MSEAAFTVIDGIRCYAPEIAQKNTGFPPDIYDFFEKIEEESFWFRSRTRVLKDLFGRWVPRRPDGAKTSVLEVGCGTGFNLKALRELDYVQLTGADIYLQGLQFARKRLPEIELVQLEISRMPFERRFDVICALDVIEHIDDDLTAMKMIHRALREGGRFIIAVPQHQFLWSSLDEVLCHKRRYSRKVLLERLKASGFEIEYASSHVFSLFPVMLVSRLLNFTKKKQNDRDVLRGLSLPKPLDAVFDRVMRLDEAMIRAKASLPFGGSLFVVARAR